MIRFDADQVAVCLDQCTAHQAKSLPLTVDMQGYGDVNETHRQAITTSHSSMQALKGDTDKSIIGLGEGKRGRAPGV